MLRAVKFLLIAAVLLVLAWWIGGLPGDVTAHVGPYTVETSTPAALLVLFLIASALFRVAARDRRHPARPGGLSAWRGGRRQQQGELATQRGIVALAAGDAAAARAEAGRARKLLGDTPLVLLLAAESARLAGQAEQAQAAFPQLTRHKDMAFLGHRGLLPPQLRARVRMTRPTPMRWRRRMRIRAATGCAARDWSWRCGRRIGPVRWP